MADAPKPETAKARLLRLREAMRAQNGSSAPASRTPRRSQAISRPVDQQPRPAAKAADSPRVARGSAGKQEVSGMIHDAHAALAVSPPSSTAVPTFTKELVEGSAKAPPSVEPDSNIASAEPCEQSSTGTEERTAAALPGPEESDASAQSEHTITTAVEATVNVMPLHLEAETVLREPAIDGIPLHLHQAPASLLPIAVKLESSLAMEIDPSPDALPVATETTDSPSPANTEAPPVIEPRSSIPGVEGLGGAALSQEGEDAPTQRSVARLSNPTNPAYHTAK